MKIRMKEEREYAEKLEKWLDERPARGAPQEPEQI